MGDVSSEPTMEEILSSIKRVIEESEGGAPGRAPRRAAATTRTAAAPLAAPVEDDAREPSDESVLELSERVGAEASAPASAEPRPETIVSADVAQATRGPLEALSRMVVKPDAPGSDTLEGMVREMLRPMLRDWLDAKLPGIVEAMVAKEIARISGRGF